MKSRLRTISAGGAVVLTAIGVFIATFVGGWEGKRNRAYKDIVGVATICYGETRGVEMGDVKTDAECLAMLGDALVEFEQGMRKCLGSAADTVPDSTYVAFLSLAYNIGTGAFCRSTVVRRATTGDVRGACDAILAFNRAGGRVVYGLQRRRAAERELCLRDIT